MKQWNNTKDDAAYKSQQISKIFRYLFRKILIFFIQSEAYKYQIMLIKKILQNITIIVHFTVEESYYINSKDQFQILNKRAGIWIIFIFQHVCS